MWNEGVPLAEIADRLRYSCSTLAKLRMDLGLRKRYGADDETPPTPEVIRLRCEEVRTNWTIQERCQRYVGVEHTVNTGSHEYR